MEHGTCESETQFSPEETAALKLVLRRLTLELQPLLGGGRRLSRQAYQRHAGQAIDRVLVWLDRAGEAELEKLLEAAEKEN